MSDVVARAASRSLTPLAPAYGWISASVDARGNERSTGGTYKLLSTDEQSVAGEAPQQRVEVYPADPQAARKLIDSAVEDDADGLVNAVGHTRFLRDAPVLAALDREEVPNSPEAFLSFAGDSAKADAATAVPLSDSMRSLLDRKAAGLTQ